MNEEMKEQIREFWYQVVQPHTGDSWEEQAAFMEKFAERIVRECIDVVDDCDVEYCTKPQQARAWCSTEIQKHFGIEG